MTAPDEIECARCEGNGFLPVPRPWGESDTEEDCPDCNGRGWRQPAQEERDDAAADAFSDMCESEPPMSADERHQIAWKQKQELRR